MSTMHRQFQIERGFFLQRDVVAGFNWHHIMSYKHYQYFDVGVFVYRRTLCAWYLPCCFVPYTGGGFIPVAINASFAFLQRFRQKKNVISRFLLPARLFLICIYLQPYCLAKNSWRPQRCFIAASAQDHRVLKPSLTSKSEPSSSRPGVKTKLRRSFLRRGRQKCALIRVG